MRKFAVMCALSLAACSSDAGTGAQNNGGDPWGFDSGVDGSANNGASNNGTPSNNGVGNNGDPGNNGTVGNNADTTGDTTGPANNGQTTGPADAGMGSADVGMGSADAGSTCTVNSDCGANLICCQGFDGAATCSEDCLSGGLCGGNDSECARGEECCELSQANLPDTCLDRCRGGGGGGGNMGTPCTTNPDCTVAGEVCCVGFDGQGTCESSDTCFTGGACEQDGDCLNQQLCCDFNVAKVCLDRCNF